MARDFRKTTDDLFKAVTHEELADEIGCSIAMVRQARREPESPAFRNPPRDWEDGALKLARAQVEHFTRLVKKLTRG